MPYKYKRSFVIGRTPEGKQIRKYVYANTKPELDEKWRQALNKYDKGFEFGSRGLTVEKWAYRWLEIYRKPSLSTTEYKKVEGYINNYIIPFMGSKLIIDMKPFQIQEFVNSLSGLSKSLNVKITGAVKGIFKTALQNGYILRNPAEDIKIRSKTEKHRRALTDEERKAMLAVAETHHAGLWALTMLYCGLRRGETVALKWENIDFKNKKLTVSQAACYETNQATEKAPKTAAGNRVIPITDHLLKRLKRAHKLSKSEYVFASENNKGMMSLTKCRRWWHSFIREVDITLGAQTYRNAIIESKVPYITPHYLRHTYATDLYLMGAPLKTAQYLLGHADIKTTANIYTHIASKAIDDVARKQNKYYQGGI